MGQEGSVASSSLGCRTVVCDSGGHGSVPPSMGSQAMAGAVPGSRETWTMQHMGGER